MASVYKRGKSWIARFRSDDGLWKAKAVGTDKGMAVQIATKLELDGQMQRSGLVDGKQIRMAAAAKAAVADHIEAYQADLPGRDRTAEYVRLAVLRIKTVLAEAAIDCLGDISSARISTALGKLRDTGLAERTIGHYTRCIKGFTRWAWCNGLAVDDPLAILTVKVSVPLGQRALVRRPFSAAELQVLLAYTKAAPRRWNMIGVDRAMLYAVTAGTGFRANELRSLTPSSFRLDEPAIMLSGVGAKNRKDVLQPISAELAGQLRGWIKGRKAALKLPSKGNIVRMLRQDMAEARIAYYRAMEPGVERRVLRHGDFLRTIDADGRHADFHALRATYITMLARANVPVKTLQTLARRSDPKLTMNTYATMGITDLTAAVATLPSFEPSKPEPQSMKATGTDDAVSGNFQRAENALKTGVILGHSGSLVVMGQVDGIMSRKPVLGAASPHEQRVSRRCSSMAEQRFCKP